jgi:uncharacterized delta-60 repeat protein
MSARRVLVSVLAALAVLALTVEAEAAGGDLDPGFGRGGLVKFSPGGTGFADAIALQSNGDILVGGGAAAPSGDFALARLLPGGSLDPAFGRKGRVTTDFSSGQDLLTALGVQADGKIVAVGYTFDGTSYRWALARYNTNGTLDTTGFGGGTGKVVTGFGNGYDFADAVAIQSDGKIVVAGEASNGSNNDFGVARYNADGTLDTAGFGGGTGKVLTDFSGSNDSGNGVAVDPLGNIVAAGYAGVDFALARYDSAGTLDPTFGGGTGKVVTDFGGNDFGHAVTLGLLGTIIVAGESTALGGADFAMARYDVAGTLDPGFGVGGKVLTDFGGGDRAYGMGVQSVLGDIVLGGGSTIGNHSYFAVAWYRSSDGTLDSSYGSGGKVLTSLGGPESAYALAVQSDDKAVAAGFAGGGFALARYLAA